jgi:VIT1/CCC1 family predicted Fe2+/Mn2+ transporter
MVAQPGQPTATAGTGRDRSTVVRRAAIREVLMGAQDNLTNVLAVMLGVAIGSGRSELVALAGVSAAVAEAVSMGGVLYSATRADDLWREHTDAGRSPVRGALSPAASGFTCFAAALLAGLVPLAPFVVLPLPAAAIVALSVSLGALFALGSWTGRIGGAIWWQDGLRLVLVAGTAALAAALVGRFLAVA